jgi:hypothetical protein
MNLHIRPSEFDLIAKIARRYTGLCHSTNSVRDLQKVMMDLIACHCNGTPLRLKEFLCSRDGDFLRDIHGISRHLDRYTGQLNSHFTPTFAATPSLTLSSSMVH